MSRRRLSGRPGISQHVHEIVRNENAAMEANIANSDRQSRRRRASMKKLRQRSRSRGRSSGNLRPAVEGIIRKESNNNDDGNEIAVEEIRRSTMQAASQNKINVKTANFYYRFIDKIEEIINVINTGEGDGDEVTKFEECGCAVETGAQIYAAKVDETYAATGRFVADLNRNSNENADDDGNDDEDDMEGTSQKKKSKKMGSGNTLDSIKNITSQRLESEYDVDPIFAKMSKNMDQGGARGMLLGKLNVENGLNIVFDTTAIIEETYTTEEKVGEGEEETVTVKPLADDEMIDLGQFQAELKDHAGWESRSVCPSLDMFYSAMSKSSRLIENDGVEPVEQPNEGMPLPAFIDMDALSGDFDDVPGDGFSPGQMPSEGFIAAPFTPSQERRANGYSANMVDPSNMEVNTDGYIAAADQEKIDNILASCPYWQCFAPSARLCLEKKQETEYQEKKKKEQTKIDFANTFVDITADEDFGPIKKKNGGKQGKTYLKKQRADMLTNMLPEDVHYKVDNLRSLFTTKRTTFGFTSRIVEGNNDAGFSPSALGGGEFYDDGGFESNLGFENEDGGGFGFSPSKADGASDEPPSPTSLVPYAKKATKFNIKDMKANMWTYIDKDANVGTEQDKYEDGFFVAQEEDSTEKVEEEQLKAEEAPEEELDGASFAHAFSQVHSETEAVSVPMMFLTMLFLANENSLALHSNSDMADIKILKNLENATTA